MIKIPLEDIIKKIKEASSLSEAEINQKIEQKTKQLSGLISKEGAAHIIANELGVKIFDQISGKLQIKNILSGMRSVETIGKVLANYGARDFTSGERTGKMGSFLIGDETGTIRVVTWGSTAEIIPRLQEGAIVKIVSGYVRDNRGAIEVHINEKSKIILNPEGENIGDIKPQFRRKSIKDLKENDTDIEVFGTIVQVFEPKFFEICPECASRSKSDGNDYRCPAHGIIIPKYSYLITIILDDGTETMRIACFRKEAETLLGINQEQFLKIKNSPNEFEPWKTELLGNQIKIIGRCNKNPMFDRLDFVASSIDTNPDPKDEIERIEQEKETKNDG